MRPFPNLPESPERIRTRFLLYTRNNTEQVITYNGPDLGDFSPERKTVFLVHGFNDNGRTGWMVNSKYLLLQQDDYNVILVDWGHGSTIPYLQATANTQLVGRQVALLVAALASRGASLAQVHLVGHSLGAHVCGYAGSHTPGLGRITGLDPAQPYFENTQPVVHLDRDDAAYVDVIHTDGRDILFLGVGFKHANGDVDFFPNDGKNQPGCGDFDAEIEGLIWDLETLDWLAMGGQLSCSHGRATELFVEALRGRQCPLVGFRCQNYDDYLSVDCQNMATDNMGVLGMDSINFNLSGSYYLQTSPDPNALCLNYFEVFIELNEDQEETLGNMVFVLNGKNNSSDRITGWRDHTAIPAGGELHTTLHTRAELGALRSVQLTYHDHHGTAQRMLSAAALRARTVDARLQTSTVRLCWDGGPLADKHTATFTPCP
ncbi:pancreatic triacylglycerol lipase-like [Pollicipes pollicipes]|uniref:pancreatic triacylglycerol lipase-like n=1 Tax=Pollicipes pollicipes TaxID=41117 RepID=UPI001884FA72|nr:pancreatic triacylglycerol lipase-like [Pollicipes pollicipes]